MKELILFIIVAIVMAVIASKKGFNPFLWILAGGIPGFILLIFMPSANADAIDEATRAARRKIGNDTGGVISCIVIVVTIGFIVRSSLMIIPVIMAIWFGITAHKAGRNWFGWALLGTLLSFIINTIILNINTIILNVEGSMFGSFSSLDSYNYFLDSYDYFRIVCLFLVIAANSVLGTVITSGLRKHATPTQYENTYRAEEHQPKRDSPNPITLTLGILIIVFLSGAVIYQYLHPECNGKIVACITEHLKQK